MRGILTAALAAAAIALAASAWFAHSKLERLEIAVARAEAGAEHAETNYRKFDDAVQILESVARPDVATPVPLTPTNRAVRLQPPFKVWDGDTFDHGGQRYRLAGVDTPGLRGRDARCPAERLLGRRAKDLVESEFARPQARVEVVTFGTPPMRDDRSRILVRLSVNGANIGQRLVDSELAVAYDRQYGWCNGR